MGCRCVTCTRAGKDARLWAMYRMRVEEYETEVEKRRGLCDLCGQLPNTDLVVDHNHETGGVRGLLCQRCNTGLGKLGDNVAGLQRALDYLNRAKLL